MQNARFRGLTLCDYAGLTPFHATLAGKLIIPVALGDLGYASDIIHRSIYINLTSLENFAEVPGLMLKRQRQRTVHELLTKERMQRLRLQHKNTPESVVETVFEILHALRLKNSYARQP